MDIYYYLEKNKCSNSGKPILYGDCKSFVGFFEEDNACAIFVNGPVGKFSGTAICLGDFDGLHMGHRALFNAAKKYGKWGVLLFDRNIKGNFLLTPQTEKLQMLDLIGSDYAVIVEFSEKFSARTPREFVEFLKNILHVDTVIAGYDYRFGHKASGDTDELIRLCGEVGIGTEIVEPVTLDNEPVKSTKIRSLISSGDVDSANRLLGYNYSISGKVIKGLQNGRKMGFPTANIQYNHEKLLPCDGVYFGKVNGFDAVINIGKNPTFDAEERTIEAHLIDFKGNLYDQRLTVFFYEKIRDDIKFNNMNELVKQIESDINYVKGRK